MMTINGTMPKTMLIRNSDGHEKVARYESQVLPRFGEYQLLGDGLCVRFADQILQQHSEISHGARAVGYCIDGQRIDQLRQRIKTKSYPLSSKVLVLIGTDDVLCGSSIHRMTKNFNALINLLKKTTGKILILTLPPIPKLCVTYFHWNLIRQFNSYLKSFHDGGDIIVADICPLFTKFKGALEYDISINREERCEPIHHFKKRKSLLSQRRKYPNDQRKLDGIESDKSDSDYKNTTDTNTSVDSEIFSSELSLERDHCRSTNMSDETRVNHMGSKNKKGSERSQSPVRFVVRTLQSVFGKDMLNRKNKTDEKSISRPPVQPEKRPRNTPFDLYDLDNWEIESDEDSMSEHVYKSQEETEYDVVEIGSQRQKKECGEFSKFVESLNENESATKKSFQCRKWKRDCTRNEIPETTESSSSSDTDSPKRNICSLVDHNFRNLLEKSWHVTKEQDCSSLGSCNSSVNSGEPLNNSGEFLPAVNSSKTESRLNKLKDFGTMCVDAGECRNIDGISEKDKLVIQLASHVCYLECYEIFYPFGKKRMNMVHLNRKGLLELRNFLISNNYVSM